MQRYLPDGIFLIYPSTVFLQRFCTLRMWEPGNELHDYLSFSLFALVSCFPCQRHDLKIPRLESFTAW